MIDFEDVLLLTVGVLQEYPQVAEAVRAQYRHFVVDEYQDVNALQQRLLDLWRGDRDDVCVVGDPSQTIYSFTGASPAHLLGFPRRHPGARVVKLVRDYRSTPQVVALANGLLARAAAGPNTPARLELVAQRPPGPAPVFTGYDDDLAEAAGVAGRIKGLLVATACRPARSPSSTARTPRPTTLEQALADAGVPYLVRGGERFFSRKEVRDARAPAARRGARGRGGGRSSRHCRTPPATCSPASAGRRRRRRAPAPSATAGSRCRRSSRSPTTWPPRTRRRASAQLVAELEERASAQHAPTVQGVTLASLHAAKGLEWDAVFLVGLSEGLMPISLAEGWEAVEEERRLLYVGVTRAREHVHLSWSRSRTPGGRGSRKPSRFLDGLLGDAAAGARSGGAGPAGPAARGRPAAPGRAAHHLPHLRRAAGQRGRAQGRALLDLPAHVRRGGVRAPARVALPHRGRGEGARLRGVHRRDPGRDRRDGAARPRPGSPRCPVSGPPSSTATAPRCSSCCTPDPACPIGRSRKSR